MFHNLLFVMSLSGTVVLLFYILTYPMAKRYFPLGWRYWVLKIAILFFLVPFPYFKYYILNVIYDIFPALWSMIHHVPEGLDTKYLVINGPHGERWFSPGLINLMILITAFVILAVVIVFIQLLRYRRMRRICLRHSTSHMDHRLQEYISQSQSQLRLGRKAQVFCSEYCSTPMTMGVWSPVIFLPQRNGQEEDAEYQYIIRHELVHVKYHDFLIRFLGLLVMALHWFNPFSWILYAALSEMIEIHCDGIVLDGKGDEERIAYGKLLLTLATDETVSQGNQLFVGFKNHKRKTVMKRRILEMKANRQLKWGLSVITMGLVCMAGTMSTFAYVPPSGIDVVEAHVKGAEYAFHPQGQRPPVQDMPYEYFFTDQAGNVYELDESDLTQKAGCSHTYTTVGTTTRHIKNSSGGCTVKEYEALKCSKCGNVKQGDLIGTHSYPSCPH